MSIFRKAIAFAALLVLFCTTCFAATPDSGKVVIDYYYGVNCHFCKDMEPWMKQIEEKYKDRVIFNRYEVQADQANAQRFNEHFYRHFPKKNSPGTPTMEIENTKMLVGENTIKENLEKEIAAAEKARATNTKYAPEQAELDKKAQEENLVPDPVPLAPNAQPSAPSNAQPKEPAHLSGAQLNAIAVAALADSVNPCAMLVLIILLSSLVVYNKGGKKKAVLITVSFISAVYITYFLIGFGLTHFLAFADLGKPILYAVGGIAIFVGLVNIKDAVLPKTKCGLSLEIPQAWRTKLMEVIRKATSPVGAFASGILVTMFELPCTGGPYLFGTTLIATAATFNERVLLLLFYNAIFILPLVLLAFVIIAGVVSVEKAEVLRDAGSKYLHAIVGILMFGLGLWVLFQ